MVPKTFIIRQNLDPTFIDLDPNALPPTAGRFRGDGEHDTKDNRNNQPLHFQNSCMLVLGFRVIQNRSKQLSSAGNSCGPAHRSYKAQSLHKLSA